MRSGGPGPDVVETTEVKLPRRAETTEVPAADEDSSDTPEVPACEPVDGTEHDRSSRRGRISTGDTTGTVTDTVADTAVPSADDALLAAARDVKAFAASL